MSWSVSGIGKPDALAAKLASDFSKITPMSEPEETGKNAALAAVAAIVPAYPSTVLVKVECNGSQYQPNKDEPKYVNSLSIKIESLGSIVE